MCETVRIDIDCRDRLWVVAKLTFDHLRVKHMWR